jgi:hypothetical protein
VERLTRGELGEYSQRYFWLERRLCNNRQNVGKWKFNPASIGATIRKKTAYHLMPGLEDSDIPKVINHLILAHSRAVDSEIGEGGLVELLIAVPRHVDHRVANADPIRSES